MRDPATDLEKCEKHDSEVETSGSSRRGPALGAMSLSVDQSRRCLVHFLAELTALEGGPAGSVDV